MSPADFAWLSFQTPSSASTWSSMPTIPRSMTSM